MNDYDEVEKDHRDDDEVHGKIVWRSFLPDHRDVKAANYYLKYAHASYSISFSQCPPSITSHDKCNETFFIVNFSFYLLWFIILRKSTRMWTT